MALPKILVAQVAQVVDIIRHRLGWLQRRMVSPPTAMLELIVRTWTAQAITAAADLGIADALANGPLTAEELAAAVDADADALSRLLRALISCGIFRQRPDGRYDLTPMADTLRTDAEVSVARDGAIPRGTSAPRALEPPDGCHPYRAADYSQVARQAGVRIPGRRAGVRRDLRSRDDE